MVYCVFFLNRDNQNRWKAQLRKGEAYVFLKSPDEAKAVLNTALSNCVGDAAATSNIER
jgi:hypothetical protein